MRCPNPAYRLARSCTVKLQVATDRYAVASSSTGSNCRWSRSARDANVQFNIGQFVMSEFDDAAVSYDRDRPGIWAGRFHKD